MSFFSDLISTIVRGGLAFYTGGLSEVAFSAVAPDDKAGKIGGAIGGVLGNTWGGGDNVVSSDGPLKSATNMAGAKKGVNAMKKPLISSNMPKPESPGVVGSVVGWMKENPELTQMIGSGVANMFKPDEIDIMREKAKLASRNYDGSGIVNLPGRSGSFGQRADQERPGVRGDYTESSRSAESIDPFVGAGERPSVFNRMKQQRYNTEPQEYYDSLRKNRGIIGSRLGGM